MRSIWAFESWMTFEPKCLFLFPPSTDYINLKRCRALKGVFNIFFTHFALYNMKRGRMHKA